MSNLKKQYEDILIQMRDTYNEINELEKDEKVKKYIDLQKLSTNLNDKRLKLYRSIMLENYSSCNHILVYTREEYDKSWRFHGCIKCGLDSTVLDAKKEWLSYSKRIMYDYIRRNGINGIKIIRVCDLSLAHKLYTKIKENNPDASDEMIAKYFEIELDNINEDKKLLKKYK